MLKSNENEPRQNLDAEESWHKTRFYIDSGHWTSHPLLASRERHWLNYDVAKIRFYGYLARYINKKAYYTDATILMAPSGNGEDFKYLIGLYKKVFGIDISNIAISQCPKIINAKKGDILQSGYENNSFDVIICSQFLHHVHEVGFSPFLEEFYRILRGGVLAILEPGSMYPFSWVTALANKIMGNVTGKVATERPIFPPKLNNIITSSGFKRIHIRGLSFSHGRFPVPIQFLLNLIDYPGRSIWPLKLFSSNIGWFCEKPTR